ncbi:MAG: hypothetical protein WBF95_16425 [Comamonas thiooxydans]
MRIPSFSSTIDTDYGKPFEGGFYGGVININSHIYAIVWAPKSTQIKAEIDVEKANAFDPADSYSNTVALADAGSPLARAALAANINGYNDWLIPARDVLELGYRMLKPSKNQNYANWFDGVNRNSLPEGKHYSESYPAQTIASDFLDGGSESFDLAWYWSSSLHSGGVAFCQHFEDGYQSHYHSVSAVGLARFVRLTQVPGQALTTTTIASQAINLHH